MREYGPQPEESPYCYYLVESRVCPDTSEGFKSGLQDGEPFESDFIIASKEECQNWALDKWSHTAKYNFIEHGIIAIADARSAQDGTLLMSFHYDCPPDLFPEYEENDRPLPPNNQTWYDFWVHHTNALNFQGSLLFTEPDVAYPLYFGFPEKFTNEAGVFEVWKMDKYLADEED